MSALEPRWKNDTGVDPYLGITDQIRQDESVAVSDIWVRILSNLACLGTLPFSGCWGLRTVGVVEDVIVTRCGVVTDVLRTPGMHFVNPCFTETFVVDMGLNDIEITKMNANDSRGNPLLVSAQFVYRVSDSISYVYKTKNLTKFIKEQGESALQAVLSQYSFDNGGGDGDCLRKHSTNIEGHLARVLQVMVQMMGVKIESFRIINVGVEPRMEKLLLARQEAEAEVTARTAIAEGTTGIIHETISRLNALGIRLSDEEQSKFATNLTLMLVNHGHTTLNLYQETAPSGLRMTGKEKV